MTAKFQDIIPPNKRSIRNVPLNISVEDKPKHVKKSTLEHDSRELIKIVEKERRSGRVKSIWTVAIGVLIVLALIIVSKFATATATLVVSHKPIVVKMDLNLSHNSTSSNAVDFDIITLSVNETVPDSSMHLATGTAALGTKATGSVVISNNFSTKPQILVKKTRLESTGGKIYYLVDSVTVPGQTTVKGVTTAGGVIAKVVAEKEGTAYNIDSMNFTLPALKGTPRYKSITAKVKTAIAGGAEAHSKMVIDESALDSIHDSLFANAQSQILATKSDDYILVGDSVQDSIEVDDSGTAVLNISALVLKKSDLINQIQSHNNLDINISQGSMPDIILGTSSLSLKLPSDLKLSASSNDETVKVGLSGTTTITSNFESSVLKKQLAGLNYDPALKLLKNKIGAEAVNLEIWPWWIKTVPSNENRINIKIENN